MTTSPPTTATDSDFTLLPLPDLLDAIGAEAPVPGGGAVAAITNALAAATARMVVSYSIGRRNYEAHAELHETTMNQLKAAQRQALAMAKEDAEAYARLAALWKLPEDSMERRRDYPAAALHAITAPHSLLGSAVSLLEIIEKLPGRTNANLVSDLEVAAILAEAAAHAAAANVRVNLPLLEDDTERDALEVEATRALSRASKLRQRVERTCRGG